MHSHRFYLYPFFLQQPDIYKQAVLREPSHKSFTISSDLWSLGVTLYHIVTGQVPFKPYGGRKNREMMLVSWHNNNDGEFYHVKSVSVFKRMFYRNDLVYCVSYGNFKN